MMKQSQQMWLDSKELRTLSESHVIIKAAVKSRHHRTKTWRQNLEAVHDAMETLRTRSGVVVCEESLQTYTRAVTLLAGDVGVYGASPMPVPLQSALRISATLITLAAKKEEGEHSKEIGALFAAHEKLVAISPSHKPLLELYEADLSSVRHHSRHRQTGRPGR